MTRIAFVKFLLPVLFCSLMFAPMGLQAADGIERLKKNSERISTVSADFVQKKFMKILSRPLVSEGKFYYAAPASLRWEYVKPVRSVVLSDKGKTRRYIASGGKMVEDRTGGAQAMQVVLSEAAGWMSGRFVSNPAFAATFKEGPDTVITLTPVGKSMAGMIEKIEITVSRKDASVKSVRILESAAAETRIDFQHVVINSSIQPSVFQDVQ